MFDAADHQTGTILDANGNQVADGSNVENRLVSQRVGYCLI